MSVETTSVPAGSGPDAGGAVAPAAGGPAGRPTDRAESQSAPRSLDTLLESPVLWVLWGVAMAVMGIGVPEWDWPPGAGGVAGLVLCVVLAALAAQPYTGRQIIVSSHFHHKLAIHRNTLLSAGFVVLVAGQRPPAVWEAAVDAALLAGYLLLLDAATVPFPVLRRLAHPLFLLGAAGLTAAATALIALPGTDSTLREVAVTAASVSMLAVAMATGFRTAESRRVGSRGPEAPQTDKARR
jgi:hypothetical protein